MKRGYYLTGACMLLLSACAMQESRLETALQHAGNNRVELQKVLKHFERDNDKYRAACFLIENMPYYGYYEGEALVNYTKYFEVYADGRHDAARLVDSLKKADGEFFWAALTRKKDIETVDSAFLVNNIEWAFKVWKEQPWGKNVCFDDFCEYILPYRILDEPLVQWREEIYNRYNPILDNIRGMPEAEDPVFVAKVLMDSLSKAPIYFTGLFPEGPHLGPDVLKWRSGSCREFTDIITYVLRAVGIPCGEDKVIMRGDCNASHFWNFALNKNRETYTLGLEGFTMLHKAVELDLPKGKVYRTTFSLNRNIMEEEHYPVIHPAFKRPFFCDVTSVYADSLNRRITFSAKQLYGEVDQRELIYLCVSKRNEWMPVAYAPFKNGKVCFEDVEGGLVFTLATWDGATLKVLSDPFFVDRQTGDLRAFKPGKESRDITLYCKYTLAFELHFFRRMLDGVVEGSNRPDYKDADTLHIIKEVPMRLFTTVNLNPDKPYRYVRYIGSDGNFCNIAELELYENISDTIPLKGFVSGTPGCWLGDGSHEYTNVFDGNPYTSFDYKEADGGWAGMDLGHKRILRKIVYAPRNRDNFIRKGDKYELFYCDEGRWNSLGAKVATSDSLVYQVPEGALLYLKNYTRGNDERIFEYKDHEQIFW